MIPKFIERIIGVSPKREDVPRRSGKEVIRLPKVEVGAHDNRPTLVFQIQDIAQHRMMLDAVERVQKDEDKLSLYYQSGSNSSSVKGQHVFELMRYSEKFWSRVEALEAEEDVKEFGEDRLNELKAEYMQGLLARVRAVLREER